MPGSGARDSARPWTRARAGYIRRQFGVDWMDLRNYDLSLDTGRLGWGAAWT